MNNNTHLTQKIFFQAITRKKLNELFHRADSERMSDNISILAKDIAQILNNQLRVKSVVNRKDNHCDIIITYYNHNYNHNNEIGHLTIHCKVDNTTLHKQQRMQGRIHFKNKFNNSCYTLKCKSRPLQNANTSVTISHETGKFIRPKLKQCLDATLLILNHYLDFNSELSLDIPMTKYRYEDHPCFVEEKMKAFEVNPKTRFRKTIRASMQARKNN